MNIEVYDTETLKRLVRLLEYENRILNWNKKEDVVG